MSKALTVELNELPENEINNHSTASLKFHNFSLVEMEISAENYSASRDLWLQI